MLVSILINASTLQTWLERGTAVSILDIRPIHQRAEVFIPQSIHFNAYDKLQAAQENAFKDLHLDKAIPVVTVCAGGKLSIIAAEILKREGYEAYSFISKSAKGASIEFGVKSVSLIAEKK